MARAFSTKEKPDASGSIGMAPVPAKRTLLQFLRSPHDVLNRHRKPERSVFFERLIVQTFASLLNLPFNDIDDDTTEDLHRVTWFGSIRRAQRAHGNHPDGLARAHKFAFCIEATQSRGSDQCVREFGQADRHARRVIADCQCAPNDIYIAFVTHSLSNDTFLAIKASVASGPPRIIPFELPILFSALETSLFAETMRHIEFRKLLQDLNDAVQISDRLDTYRIYAQQVSSHWQKAVLELEMATMLALRSYQAILLTRRDFAGLSEILLQLQKDRFLKQYINKLDGVDRSVNADLIERSLLQESLGVVVGRLLTGERLFAPVSIPDFRSRCNRRLARLESIGASF